MYLIKLWDIITKQIIYGKIIHNIKDENKNM